MRPSKKNRRMRLFVMVLFSVIWLPNAAAASDGDLLRRTMADVSLLKSQLVQRRVDAVGIREALMDQLKTIRSEARREAQERGIKTLAEAKAHPRLYYDLILMAEIQAYIDRYTQKIAYYRVACDRLGYLYQQADDDLKIISTLSGLKIDSLAVQAEKMRDAYLSEAQTLVIPVDAGSVIEPTEAVWDSLKTGR
ncbi:MAG: hypothetical protein WBY88_13770 [Desulfosarcina sp.]